MRINNVGGTVTKCVHSRVFYGLELVASFFKQGLPWGEVKMQMLSVSEMTDTRRQVCMLGHEPVAGYCLLSHRKEKN